MFKNNLLLISLSLVIFVSCKGDVTHKKNQSPKNIILLISDGAGLSQISSAYFYKNEPVNYSRFNDIGLIETFSSNKDITDSLQVQLLLQQEKKRIMEQMVFQRTTNQSII